MPANTKAKNTATAAITQMIENRILFIVLFFFTLTVLTGLLTVFHRRVKHSASIMTSSDFFGTSGIFRTSFFSFSRSGRRHVLISRSISSQLRYLCEGSFAVARVMIFSMDCGTDRIDKTDIRHWITHMLQSDLHSLFGLKRNISCQHFIEADAQSIDI
jgi:hypothetical protein